MISFFSTDYPSWRRNPCIQLKSIHSAPPWSLWKKRAESGNPGKPLSAPITRRDLIIPAAVMRPWRHLKASGCKRAQQLVTVVLMIGDQTPDTPWTEGGWRNDKKQRTDFMHSLESTSGGKLGESLSKLASQLEHLWQKIPHNSQKDRNVHIVQTLSKCFLGIPQLSIGNRTIC